MPSRPRQANNRLRDRRAREQDPEIIERESEIPPPHNRDRERFYERLLIRTPEIVKREHNRPVSPRQSFRVDAPAVGDI